MTLFRGPQRRTDFDVELQKTIVSADRILDPNRYEDHPALPSIEVVTMAGGSTDNMESTSPQLLGNPQPSDPASSTQSQHQEMMSALYQPTLAEEIMNGGSPDGSISHGSASRRFSMGQTESTKRAWKEVKVKDDD